MHNVNNPEFKQRFSFDDKESMNEFAASLNRNPMVKSVNQTDKLGVEVVARDPQTLSKLNEMYDTTPVDPKKKMKDVEEPLKGKGYPHNEKKKDENMMYAHKGTHFFKDGKPYEGPVHKMPNGEVHTGEKHTKDSKQVFHSKKDAMEGEKKNVKEEIGLDEAKTVTLVAKKGSKTLETVKKVSPKERKTVEMLMKSAHGKDVKIEVVKEESDQIDELSPKTLIRYNNKASQQVTRDTKTDRGRVGSKTTKRLKGALKARKKLDKIMPGLRGEDVEQVLEGDGVMIRELGLYIANNGDMYRQRIQPIIKNMRKKLSKGVYDEKLAAKGFMHAVTDGIKRYNKEFGAGSMKLAKSEKEEVASILLRDYQSEIREGVNYEQDASALLKKRIFDED